jgi:hypothetical protein
MDHGNYLNLKKKVKNKNFHNSYKGFSEGFFKVSFLGNFLSILFAFFFAQEVIMKAVLEPNQNTHIYTGIAAVIILVFFEYIKRFVFDRFSISYVNNKCKFNNGEVGLLTAFSMFLIAGSFYLSLNGAKNFASRDKEIVNLAKSDITSFKDSIDTKYNNLISINDSLTSEKILVLEENNKTLFEKNLVFDSDISSYKEEFQSLSVETWQERSKANKIQKEMKAIRLEKDKNVEIIDKNTEKIEVLEEKRDTKNSKYLAEANKIKSTYEKDKNESSNDKIKDNEGNSIIFLSFSTIIELLILFGIFFKHYFEFRSVEEYEKKIGNDPTYKKFHAWNTLLDVIMGNDEEIGTPLPYKKNMMKLLSANKVDMNTKQFDDALMVFTRLGILKKKGNKKLINTTIDVARDVIMKNLKID